MNTAFHTAVSGMSAFQTQIDTLANNMANVNTVGYKSLRVSFSDLLYTKMDINNQTDELVGHGVKAASTDLIFNQSSFNMTGFALDFAIDGNGFFAIENSKGETLYTRNGAFDISVEGKNGYLVTANGEYVLDNKGRQIKLDEADNAIGFDLSNLAQKIGLFSFDNPYGLVPATGGFYQTTTSGEAKEIEYGASAKDQSAKILQFALENSKVDLAQAMTDVMLTQKAYQINAKMVQTADNIEEVLNNLRN